jgi:hypothetical protein
MHRQRRFIRLAALVVSGGCLMQLVGCLSGLVPVYVSFAESAALSILISQLVNL